MALSRIPIEVSRSIADTMSDISSCEYAGINFTGAVFKVSMDKSAFKFAIPCSLKKADIYFSARSVRPMLPLFVSETADRKLKNSVSDMLRSAILRFYV